MDRSPCLDTMKPESEGEPTSDAGDTTPTASETVLSGSSSGSQSDTSVETTGNATHKRNSLEIRNNIPDVSETKSYGSDSVDNLNKLQTTGGVAKIRKKSPGLARRLAESMQIQNQDRDTSSSERESEPAQIDTTVHSAQKNFESHLKTGSAPVNTPADSNCIAQNEVENVLEGKKTGSFENLCDSLLGNGPNGSPPKNIDSDISPDDSEKAKSMEVENEYDYIKYARIQHGDSYVGMRLAYSTSQDPLNAKPGWNEGMPPSDEEYLGSSREGSPEKMSQARQAKLKEQLRMSKVSEDTLTEIPLNGSDHAANDDRNFSLSPEATECDSAEVESVLSDEGKSSTSGMPNVEDGLSSSQGSDAEDMSAQDTPAEILKRRYKAEITQGLQGPEPGSNGALNAATNDNSSSIHSTPSHTSDGSRSKSDDIDMAIRDIKSAIERSKEAARERGDPAEGGGDGSQSQEPIWVMRDSYVRKIGNHDDLNQVREEYQRHHQGELQQQEEHVFQGEDEQEGDSPNKYPYGRHANKNFPSGKGFQSDDDIEARNREVFQQTRTVKGSHYRALPPDDPEENKSLPTKCHHHSNNGYMSKQYGSHGDTDSGPSSVVGAMPSHNPSVVNPTSSGDSTQGPSQSNRGPSHKPFQSFSSAIPNSRYRSTAYSQHPGPCSQGTGDPNQSNHQSSRPQQQSPPGAPQCDTASAVSPAMEQTAQQPRTKQVRTNPFNNLPQDSPEIDPRFVTNTAPHFAKCVGRVDPERAPEPDRRRRRRYPSYEYHDDSDDDYYYEADGHEVAYIRERGEYDTDEETDELLDKQYMRSEKVDIPELTRPPVNKTSQPEKRRNRAREVLIEGVLFRARYLGSTQLISEGQPSKALRMMQAQEAVGRIKAPEGENQPSTEVDLFVSIEKIMVLNTDLQEIMMDHALRTISYIADIGDILVIMARRGPVMSHLDDDDPNRKRQTKICCHVFESEEAQLIAQSIGQAFQVAYMEFLKANGIDDPGMFKEIDYQEVLNQQEIFGEELFLFSNKEMQKEVIVPKLKNEPLGVVIVESGWGSMVPTVVLANMSPAGAAARCGQLNIGDQIMSINGVSLVGLPLSSCQTYIKAAKNQSVVKLNVVSCAPVVEVCIKRPDVKYQLGFSVQNGVICSLLRGGIAERGGVRVGHRIIEINSESVVAVPHEKIVKMLATSVGEIHMKTMPTSIFRLLTGQDTPHYI